MSFLVKLKMFYFKVLFLKICINQWGNFREKINNLYENLLNVIEQKFYKMYKFLILQYTNILKIYYQTFILKIFEIFSIRKIYFFTGKILHATDWKSCIISRKSLLYLDFLIQKRLYQTFIIHLNKLFI